MRMILTCLLVGFAIVKDLGEVKADLPEGDSHLIRSIQSFRREPVSSSALHGVVLGGKPEDDGRDDDPGQHQGNRSSEENDEDSSSVHDSPWMPIGVIAGFLIVGSVCFVSIQRYRRNREQMTNSESGQIEASAPPPEIIVDERSERLKKISTIIPVADGPVVVDPNVEHWVHEAAGHEIDPLEPPPAYDTISIREPNNAWVHETVSVPKRSYSQERF